MKKLIRIISFFIILSISLSCEKDFLEKKPDSSIIVPFTLDDLQLLLDNNTVMNVTPGISTIASDDFVVSETAWQSLSTPIQRNCYIWADDVYEGNFVSEWVTLYNQIFYANVVLERLNKISPVKQDENHFNDLKGNALFYRAHAFYQLAEVFAMPYEASKAKLIEGIILPLSSDVNIRYPRSNLENVYKQIEADLIEAEKLLPIKPQVKTRASKWAVYALLSRISLTKQDYNLAENWANKALEISNTLNNYNLFNPLSNYSFPTFVSGGNSEIIFYTSMTGYVFFTSATTAINSDIYKSYDSNDLRKTLFGNQRSTGIITFKGSYSGSNSLFTGLATDEIYLIRSECLARKNDLVGAQKDLNTLLKTRWKLNTFSDFNFSSQENALELILKERRKQLISRGLRWSDLRRLNQDSKFEITLSRKLFEKNYQLLPRSNKYAFPIPNDELRNGVNQNPR